RPTTARRATPPARRPAATSRPTATSRHRLGSITRRVRRDLPPGASLRGARRSNLPRASHPCLMEIATAPGGRLAMTHLLCRGNRVFARGRAQRAAMLCRLLLRQAQLFHHRLAHEEFLHLAGDGHREAVDEFDVARDLVMRDLALAEGADILRAHRSGAG